MGMLGPFYGYQNQSGTFSLHNGTYQRKIAQSFLSSGDHRIESVRLYLKKTGTPPGNMKVEIREDDGAGNPTTTIINNGSSQTIIANNMSTIYEEYIFNFTPTAHILDGQRYHIVFYGTDALTEADNIDVGYDDTSSSYNNGRFFYTDISNDWVAGGADIVFKVYLEIDDLPPTLAEALADIGTPPLNVDLQQLWLTSLVNALSTYFPSVVPPDYGGTGIGEYEAGDMLVATSAHHLERLRPGIAGSVLSVGADGLPSFAGPGNKVVMYYINETGAQLDPGDAVIHDVLNNNSIKKTTILGDPLFAGVVNEVTQAGELTAVVVNGLTKVRAQGAIVRGMILGTSQVTGRAADCTGALILGGMRALENGSSGNLIDVFVSTVAGSAGAGGFAKSFVTGSLTKFTWNRCTQSGITLPIFGGRVMAFVQIGIINSSAQTTNAYVSLYMDGVLQVGEDGIFQTGVFANSTKQVQFFWPLLITPMGNNSHLFEIGIYPDGDSIVVKIGVGASNPDSAFIVTEF